MSFLNFIELDYPIPFVARSPQFMTITYCYITFHVTFSMIKKIPFYFIVMSTFSTLKKAGVKTTLSERLV